VDRTKEVHGLLKIPDYILLKEANKEIGILNSYIDELKYNIDILEEKNKALTCENKVLAEENADNFINPYKSIVISGEDENKIYRNIIKSSN
jgi:hypothetical protein